MRSHACQIRKEAGGLHDDIGYERKGASAKISGAMFEILRHDAMPMHIGRLLLLTHAHDVELEHRIPKRILTCEPKEANFHHFANMFLLILTIYDRS